MPNRIIEGDAAIILKNLQSDAIHLTVTSPPYDNMRLYKGSHTFDFQTVAQELYRVTCDGGIVVWVVGDETNAFAESMTSFKQALFFVSCGFKLLDTMIYHKQNYPPAYPCILRYANQFDYMFVFVKGTRPRCFNPVQVERKKIYNSKNTTSYRKPDGTQVTKSIQSPKTPLKNATNVWSFAVGGGNNKHPAVFPMQLAENHIKTWSREGDMVLDPFGGSGTTAIAAKSLNRQFTYIEIAHEYVSETSERLKELD
jgi:DNA modification methylase